MLSTDKDFAAKLDSLRSYLQETTNQLYHSIASLQGKVRDKDAYGEGMLREDIGEIIDRLDIALDDLHEHVVAEEDDIDLDDVTCCASSCDCKEDAASPTPDAVQPSESPAAPESGNAANPSDAELLALLEEINSFNDELTSKLTKPSFDDIQARIFAELILGAVGL